LENISKKINYTSWSNPYDPQTYTTLKLDITKIIPYLKEKSEKINRHITPTIFTVKLMAIILKKYPEVYGYIKFGVYDTKDGVDICCLVQVGDGKELANTTIIDCDKKNFQQITDELVDNVKLLRARKNKDQNFKMKIFKFIPTYITGPFTQIVSYLSSIGVKFDALGLKKFEFGSCVITSIGGLGIEHSYAPIPPLTFAPLLLTLCSKYNVNKRDDNGNIETRTYLRMNFTADYRFFNMKNSSQIFKDIHLFGEDPEKFENECKKCGIDF
jgi:pyruvate/2-oxoglutarate dehydrogenase complex dihydrolipoamide acyltransferase (E2) component